VKKKTKKTKIRTFDLMFLGLKNKKPKIRTFEIFRFFEQPKNLGF